MIKNNKVKCHTKYVLDELNSYTKGKYYDVISINTKQQDIELTSNGYNVLFTFREFDKYFYTDKQIMNIERKKKLENLNNINLWKNLKLGI